MNEEKIRNLLPIGSVVLVREMQHPVMIYGILQKDVASGRTLDYISVLWPEGNGGAGTQLMFNHEDIEKVFFRGLNLIERDFFIDSLAEAYKSGKLKTEPENTEKAEEPEAEEPEDDSVPSPFN